MTPVFGAPGLQMGAIVESDASNPATGVVTYRYNVHTRVPACGGSVR